MLKFLIALVACMDIAGPCPAAASDKPQKFIWTRTNISSENPSLSYGNTRTLVLPMCPSRDLTHIVQNRVFVRRSNLRNCFSCPHDNVISDSESVISALKPGETHETRFLLNRRFDLMQARNL